MSAWNANRSGQSGQMNLRDNATEHGDGQDVSERVAREPQGASRSNGVRPGNGDEGSGDTGRRDGPPDRDAMGANGVSEDPRGSLGDTGTASNSGESQNANGGASVPPASRPEQRHELPSAVNGIAAGGTYHPGGIAVVTSSSGPSHRFHSASRQEGLPAHGATVAVTSSGGSYWGAFASSSGPSDHSDSGGQQEEPPAHPSDGELLPR